MRYLKTLLATCLLSATSAQAFTCKASLVPEASTADVTRLALLAQEFGGVESLSLYGGASYIEKHVLADFPGDIRLATATDRTFHDLDRDVMMKLVRPALYTEGYNILFWSVPNRTKIIAYVTGFVGSRGRGTMELGLSGEVLVYDLACR